MYVCMYVCICRNIKSVGVSAVSGEGITTLFECLRESRIEFQETYLPELERSAQYAFYVQYVRVYIYIFVCMCLSMFEFSYLRRFFFSILYIFLNLYIEYVKNMSIRCVESVRLKKLLT